MSIFIQCIVGMLVAVSPLLLGAQERLENRGHDPFFQISAAIKNCPEPAGPRVSHEEWMSQSHHRIEHGNHCWIEGRCRLPNAFDYDDEIADATRRRLEWLSSTLPAWKQSTLWVTVYQRWILIQGCVTGDFPRDKFLAEMGEVADAERVVGELSDHPGQKPPYALFH
ncbi:BON domain-containing protein [Paraburkholderia bengalensis]|uniref:BON domain-containing protein n=1 Tax=Paraburkholderia bengalensis TaxID=2747562 RepID=A0ABU8IZS6_9BURK